MRQIFKQRIVGAVVLIALGVIFLPFLFTLEPQRPIDTTSQIPPAPDIEPVIVAGPERSANIEVPKPPEDAFLPLVGLTGGEQEAPVGKDIEPATQSQEQASAPAATDETEERPALAGNTLASWVVQVASVRDQAAANNLRDKLLAGGHKAYVRSALAGGNTTYRVFVGPMALRERADADKAAIDKAFGVQSLVMRFEP